jgi:toxin FitB
VAFLLDTNVVSEIQRARPDRSVRRWLDGTASVDLHLSVLVVGEIRRGVEPLRTRDQNRARALDEWLDGLVDRYGDRLLPVTPAVADAWGRLATRRPLPTVHGLMLATAEVHGLTFVTREARSFADLGVPTVSPWETESGERS